MIDALDESGVEASRKEILGILASTQVTELLSSIHILIMSHPLPDITEALQDVPHITCRSMDDISTVSAEHNIHLYISAQLGRKLMDRFTGQQVSHLIQLADGLFEWARLACEFIKSWWVHSHGAIREPGLCLAWSRKRIFGRDVPYHSERHH